MNITLVAGIVLAPFAALTTIMAFFWPWMDSAAILVWGFTIGCVLVGMLNKE
jgi:hypothetical protein